MVDVPPMSLQFAHCESMMMATTERAPSSSVRNTTNTGVQQKTFSLVGVLNSRRNGSTLHREHTESESDDTASKNSDKRRQRRNSIV